MSHTKEAYSEAKKALNASAPERVIGRNKENQELANHLISCFEENNSLSLYVNGQPGTGKTFSVNHMLENLNKKSLYKMIHHEMVLNGADSSKLSTPVKRSTKENLAKLIEVSITTIKTHIVLVLDEIDQIETSIKSTTDLYRLFEWPYLPNSKLILIGIANSLDFTDRLLPRLELKPECKPRIIKFLPYSKNDIIEIIKDRLKEIQETHNNCVIIDDRALMLCASKIASTTGDIRKVLDICRRAIEFIEQEAKLSNQLDTIKTVGIAQMMRIFNEVNPITNSNLDKNTMPLLQKILLCTILLCTKELNVKEVALSKLFDRFNNICKAYSTAIDSESEFFNLCALVQDNGLVDIKKLKEVRNFKVSLRIDEQELKDKLQDESFMADILTNKLYK